jgi:hypothetical protein
MKKALAMLLTLTLLLGTGMVGMAESSAPVISVFGSTPVFVERVF